MFVISLAAWARRHLGGTRRKGGAVSNAVAAVGVAVGGKAVAAIPEPPSLFLETAGPSPWHGGMGSCPAESA